MDHATTAQAIIGLTGLGIGYATHALIYHGKIDRFRERIEAQRAVIVQSDEDLSDLTGENVGLAQQLGRAKAENIALKPDAEAHRKSVAQRNAALAKAQEVNARRAAAKAAGNVTSIPKRERA